MKRSKILIILIIISLSFLIVRPLFAQSQRLSAEVLFAFGKAFFEQKRYAEAKIEFEKCLMLEPQHAQARSLLELCKTKILEGKEEAMIAALAEAEQKTEAKIEAKTETPLPPIKPEQMITPEEEALAPPLQKGAWTLKKGETYAEIYTKYYWNNSQFTNGREKEKWAYDGKYDEIMAQLKLEYGLTDQDTLLFYTTAKQAHWKDSFKSSTKKGVTKIEPGIKHLLFSAPFIGTLQLKTKIPLHYSEEATPALDKHQIDIETRFLTAEPWPKLPGYTKFELGFRYRTEEPSNEIPYFFEFGYNLMPSIILKTTLDGQTAVGGGTKEDWIKYTLGPIFKIGDLFNIEFGYGYTFAGRNSSAAQEVFTTLSRQW